MNLHQEVTSAAEGQATYGMANLWTERTGLPFLVFISQRDDARHDMRVKVSPSPGTRTDQMNSCALRPFRHVAGSALSAADESLLRRWVQLNLPVLTDHWTGDIAFTEDALDQLSPI